MTHVTHVTYVHIICILNNLLRGRERENRAIVDMSNVQWQKVIEFKSSSSISFSVVKCRTVNLSNFRWFLEINPKYSDPWHFNNPAPVHLWLGFSTREMTIDNFWPLGSFFSVGDFYDHISKLTISRVGTGIPNHITDHHFGLTTWSKFNYQVS